MENIDFGPCWWCLNQFIFIHSESKRYPLAAKMNEKEAT